MNERNLRVLEFPKILEMLASLVVTDLGREAARALCPSGVFRNAFRALTGFCFDPALQCPADVTRGITLLALTFIECTIWNYLPVTTGIFVLL